MSTPPRGFAAWFARRRRPAWRSGIRAAALIGVGLSATTFAQDVPLEHRVKAAYLFNFTKFVEWPAAALPGASPITLCTVGRTPVGDALEPIVRGESVGGHPLDSRTTRDGAGCHVLFVPHGVDAAPLLRGAQGRPVLTVGESPEFLPRGGIVNFVLEEGKVRFEISQQAAAQAQLRISSRLLRLARTPETR